MIFTNPAGLWALACLALVLGLFFFKPKFTEHPVSTHYMWRLSQKNSRRFRFSSQLPKWMILLLQMMMVILLALILSGARLTAIESGKEYVVLLDSSASMAQKNRQGESAFDRARTQTIELAEKMPVGSHMTVLLTGSGGETLISRGEKAKEIREKLMQASCGWQQDEYEAALASAQNVLRMYPNAQVLFYTDHSFENVENLDIVNVSDTDGWNVSVERFQSAVSAAGTTFTAVIRCFGEQGTLPVALYVDDVLTSAQMISFEEGQEQMVVFFQSGLREFDTARVWVDAQDGLREDNEFCCFGMGDGGGKILLVSSKPYYWQQALEAFGIYTVDWEDPISSKTTTGYDIYLFDGFVPESLPEDGVIWLTNPPEAPKGVELELEGAVRGSTLSVAQGLDDSKLMKLTQSVSVGEISVLKLIRTSDIGSFTPVLMCGELPALLAGTSEKGAPMLVMLFDLHHSNLPLLSDYLILLNHMLAYSLPSMLEERWGYVGDAIHYTDMPFAEQTQIVTPDGQVKPVYVDSFVPLQSGTYKLCQQIENGKRVEEKLYACLNEQELTKETDEETALLLARPSEEDAAVKMMQRQHNKGVDLTRVLAGLFLLCLTLECVVYHREQI